jgi:uncharacterized membrane protein
MILYYCLNSFLSLFLEVLSRSLKAGSKYAETTTTSTTAAAAATTTAASSEENFHKVMFLQLTVAAIILAFEYKRYREDYIKSTNKACTL